MNQIDKLKEELVKKLVKEIMLSGYEIAMGGDMYKSNEENVKLQNKKYDNAIKKYTKIIIYLNDDEK